MKLKDIEIGKIYLFLWTMPKSVTRFERRKYGACGYDGAELGKVEKIFPKGNLRNQIISIKVIRTGTISTIRPQDILEEVENET